MCNLYIILYPNRLFRFHTICPKIFRISGVKCLPTPNTIRFFFSHTKVHDIFS